MAEPARAALPEVEYEFRPSTVGSGWTALYKRDPDGLDEWELVGTLQPGALRPLARALAAALRRPLSRRRQALVADWLEEIGAARRSPAELVGLLDEQDAALRRLLRRYGDEQAKRAGRGVDGRRGDGDPAAADPAHARHGHRRRVDQVGAALPPAAGPRLLRPGQPRRAASSIQARRGCAMFSRAARRGRARRRGLHPRPVPQLSPAAGTRQPGHPGNRHRERSFARGHATRP